MNTNFIHEFDREIPPLQQFLRRVSAPVIGVTGDSYRAEVAELIAAIVREHWRDQINRIVHVADVANVTELLPHVQPDDVVVLNLTPDDLADCHHSPHIAVITGIDMAAGGEMSEQEFNNRTEAMLNLIRYQQDGDTAVYNDESPILHEVAKVIIPDTMADGEAVPNRDSAFYYDGGFYYKGDEIVANLVWKDLSNGVKMVINLAVAATWEITGHNIAAMATAIKAYLT